MSDKKINDGGPAFPVPVATPYGDGWMAVGGMTLRDYFAAKAPPEEVNTIMVHAGWTNLIGPAWLDCVTAARWMWADAMIRARDLSTTSDT